MKTQPRSVLSEIFIEIIHKIILQKLYFELDVKLFIFLTAWAECHNVLAPAKYNCIFTYMLKLI